MMKKIGLILIVFLIPIIYIPLVVIFYKSILISSQNILSPVDNSVFYWYKELLADKQLISSLYNSLIVSTSTTLLSFLIGTLTAIGLNSSKGYFVKIISTLIVLPLLAPDISTSCAQSILFSFTSIKHTHLAIVLSQSISGISIFCLITSTILIRINKNLIDAASDYGANKWVIFKEILFPFIYPSLIVSIMVSFSLCFSDLNYTLFNSGPSTTTFALYLYSSIRFKLKPVIFALFSIIILICIIIVIISSFYFKIIDSFIRRPNK